MIYLNQGDIYFGDYSGEIVTILGSCVSVILWHPIKYIGGMCHIVMPYGHNTDVGCDNRYADCAIENFIRFVNKFNTSASEYWVGVYGGGDMFPDIKIAKHKRVGDQNLDYVCELLKAKGFKIEDREIGGNVRRRLSLNIKTGDINIIDTEMPIS
jgi:chemotaxis protein CheD